MSALSGAADANPSEQQAALRLLLLKMKNRAGGNFLLACAGFFLCGLMTAEGRVREQDVAAEEMSAPGAGAQWGSMPDHYRLLVNIHGSLSVTDRQDAGRRRSRGSGRAKTRCPALSTEPRLPVAIVCPARGAHGDRALANAARATASFDATTATTRRRIAKNATGLRRKPTIFLLTN